MQPAAAGNNPIAELVTNSTAVADVAVAVVATEQPDSYSIRPRPAD